MSKFRKHATALGLVAALFAGSTAFAAPRRDDSAPPDLISRIKTFIAKIVKALEDMRPTLPGG